MSTLLPCPCCGGGAALVEDKQGDASWYVECLDCYLHTASAGGGDFSPGEARERWNRRPDTSPIVMETIRGLEAERERLKAILERAEAAGDWRARRAALRGEEGE